MAVILLRILLIGITHGIQKLQDKLLLFSWNFGLTAEKFRDKKL